MKVEKKRTEDGDLVEKKVKAEVKKESKDVCLPEEKKVKIGVKTDPKEEDEVLGERNEESKDLRRGEGVDRGEKMGAEDDVGEAETKEVKHEIKREIKKKIKQEIL